MKNVQVSQVGYCQYLNCWQLDQCEQHGINAQNEVTGDTQLHLAVAGGNLVEVELLIEKRANVNIANKNCRTPIWKALSPFQKNIADRLIIAGAVIPDIIVGLALRCKELEILKLFLKHHVVDPSLMLVTWGKVNHPDVVDLALQHGADAQLIQDGCTPLLKLYNSNIPSFTPYRALEVADGGFTDHLITLRLAGHRFSLHGKLYEELGHRITFPSFAKTLDTLAKEEWSGYTWKHIPTQSLLSAVDSSKQAKDYVQDWERDKIVTIEAGILGHAISVVLFRDVIAIGNQGYRGAEDSPPGLTFYKMHAFASLERVITSILQLKRHDCEEAVAKMMASPLGSAEAIGEEFRSKQFQSLFQKEIPESLQLTIDHQIVLTEQRTGNCGFIAAKLSCLSIMTFLHFGGGRYTHEACELAFPLYDAVVFKDCVQAVQDLKSLRKKAPKLTELVPFTDLYFNIYSAATEISESLGRTVLDIIIGLSK